MHVTFAGAFLFPEYAAKLRKASRGLPIQFLGQLPHDLVLGLVAAADIFVCTSRDESGPVVVLEAMALGKAIVSTPVGFVPEILQDGVDVVVVPFDDARALARALEKLVAGESRRDDLGSEARRTYEAEHRCGPLRPRRRAARA